MDSRTRRENVSHIDTYLNTNSPPPTNFNANIGHNNVNVEAPRFDTNRSVFESRRNDPIKIDEPSPFNINPQPISPPSFETRHDNNNFTVNANFNNGTGQVAQRHDMMMYSQANSLGTNQNVRP